MGRFILRTILLTIAFTLFVKMVSYFQYLADLHECRTESSFSRGQEALCELGAYLKYKGVKK